MNRRKFALLLATAVMIGNIAFTACGNKATKNTVDKKIETSNKEEKIEINKISTAELKKKINEENVVLVDTREEASYLGWTLHGEERGGHIKGAVDFPTSWLDKIEDKNMIKSLEDKGIVKDKEIIIYDVDGKENSKLADKLITLGYKNVTVYTDGIIAWAQDKELPMDKLARHEKLVHPQWVNALVNGEKPETFNNDKYVVVEVSWGEGKDYKEAHIPGALHLDTGLIEEEPWWNIVSDEKIETVLTSLGINKDTTVVLYGADSTAAARAASVMMYAGVEDVRLMNGGFGAWTEAGLKTEEGVVEPTAIENFGAKVPVHPEYIINTAEAKEILADENGELVSIRSWAEYIGETSGYTYIEPKGRIAGAVWGHAGSDPYHMEHFRNVDNTMRNYHEIEAFWKDWGITSDKKVSYFCGTGWRASETFFYAHLMGWDNISVYDGGWYEWSGDESNPIESGEPERK
ncbi:rhodanese-like domain-containing protein [Oceanirhabdus sp. W0125-5]|uniref:rhodanese-like domain-containing protein n=1 Tax=Oceanirhabdus sp. W0125-5 TaxID=2999116 RepID=UPI0022F2EADB|nr:rhodanese-like domain-containing protein [Oceanirhabdus sp. W0125-5]WBW98114.1 rhodanese-like domain-containing protein [Oceanirhabdus sp. W0125-5]